MYKHITNLYYIKLIFSSNTKHTKKKLLEISVWKKTPNAWLIRASDYNRE